MLQKKRLVDLPAGPAQSIEAQCFFYGDTPCVLDERATSVRSVAVAVAATAEDTRAAICGETYDQILPRSQDAKGFAANDGTKATGYLAVFDGNLNLLWTHHVFGVHPDGECSVTAAFVRVVEGSTGKRDVLTFCGLSSFGNPPGGNVGLTPVRSFVASEHRSEVASIVAPGRAAAPEPPGSDRGQVGSRSWDGFVGRVSRDHGHPVEASVAFHAVVGGDGDDGLFEIVALDRDRFEVVGSIGAGPRTGDSEEGRDGSGAAQSSAIAIRIEFDAAEVARDLPLVLVRASTGGPPDCRHAVSPDLLLHRAQPTPAGRVGEDADPGASDRGPQ